MGKIVISDENRAKTMFYFPEVPEKFWVEGRGGLKLGR